MSEKLLIGAMCALIFASSWVLAESQPGDSKNGQVIYQRYCLRCHGEALDGKGPDAASLNVPPANFHTYLSRLKDDFELQMTITQGRMYTAMHRWGDTLTDAQVRDLISYIRSTVPHEKP